MQLMDLRDEINRLFVLEARFSTSDGSGAGDSGAGEGSGSGSGGHAAGDDGDEDDQRSFVARLLDL